MAKKNAFEDALQKLEAAVEQLEAGQLTLEQSLKVFATGVKQAEVCREALKEVDLKVEQLLRQDDGTLQVEGRVSEQ